MPGEPLTLVVATPCFRFLVVESAALLLRHCVTSGWLCSFITWLDVQGLAEHVYIEAAGEGQYLPDLLCAANALQMPTPPLAPLLPEEPGEAPFACPLGLASFARRLTSTTRTFGAVCSLLGSLAFCFPLLGISLLQCKLLLGLLVLLSSTFYQFPALTLGEDVVQVGDVLAPEKPMADLQDRQNGSGCLCLRREGGVIV